MTQSHYGGVIWTHHALDRLTARGISQETALKTFRSPDSSFKTEQGSIKYIKQFGDKRVSLIGKLTDEKEWIIVSAWVDPPLAGSEDDKKQKRYWAYKKGSWWKKVLITIGQQIGL